jgi:hypothetical protein
MTRPDEVRHHVTKPDGRFVTPARDPWVATAAERQWMRDRPVTAVQAGRRTWPLVLASAVLVLAACCIETLPVLRGALASIPWAKLFDYHPASPIDPGDRNGLLHK